MNPDSFLLTWIFFGEKQHGKRKSFWALRKVWGFLLYKMINPDEQYFLHNKGKFEIFKPFQLNLQTSANTLFSLDRGDPRCMVVRCAWAVWLLGFRVMGGAESSSHRWRIFPWSYQDAAVRSGACSFQHPLTPSTTILQSAVLSAPFCFSLFLCLSKSAFEMPYTWLHDVPNGLRCPQRRHTPGTHLILLPWSTSGTEELTQMSKADLRDDDLFLKLLFYIQHVEGFSPGGEHITMQ